MAVAKKAVRKRGTAALPVAKVPVAEKECSRFVRRRVAEALPEICESLVDKAKQGDATALKTLWQMAGLTKTAEGGGSVAKDADRRGAAFARAALKKFGGA